MTLCKYCHDKKMTVEEYKELEKCIQNKCKEFIDTIKDKNFLCYEPFNLYVSEELYWFYINELKKQGVEFTENYTYYRY